MRPRRICTDVTESEVEGDKNPLLVPAHGEEIGIWCTDEIFVMNRVHIVAMLDEHSLSSDGEIFVELDSHEPTDSAWISCLASHAP